MNTDLIIIGAGAAGLMGAVSAAECGIQAVLLERKHQPGRKILLCGNNRCNVTSAIPDKPFINAYGEPTASFLTPALQYFSSKDLQGWFKKRHLPLTIQKDKRIYPASGKADDVLHCFTDELRRKQVPIIFNCPVLDITRVKSGFHVSSESLTLTCRHVLLATGGVSYPKTGSVGDGQKMASKLGHKLTPYRPGLVGFEVKDTWLTRYPGVSIKRTVVDIVERGKAVAQYEGDVEFMRWGISGSAIVNASRYIARHTCRSYIFSVNLCPDMSESELIDQLRKRIKHSKNQSLDNIIKKWILPAEIAHAFTDNVSGGNGKKRSTWEMHDIERIAHFLTHWQITPTKPRSLKEAMVTVGGISLADIDEKTMESKKCPGLYFAGEVMDIDGPTGGFNLQAAFSTAQLAISAIIRDRN